MSLRKKYRRGTTIVEGLSFVKGKHKFKASEIANGRKFSFANIDRIFNENKNGHTQSTSPAAPPPRATTPKMPKLAPSIASKVIDAGLNVAENLSQAAGRLFQVGPGYDPQEQAFASEMERRRRKAKRKGRSI